MRPLISAFARALDALEVLRIELRDTDLRSWPVDLTPAEREAAVDLLKRSLAGRAELLCTFELLANLDVGVAKDQLLRFYLGQVCPDTKYGGYVFELETMLDDLTILHGEPALRALVRANDFDRLKLGDGRVVRSFCEALSLESIDEFREWLADVGVGAAEWNIIRLLNIGRTAGDLGDFEIATKCLFEAKDLCAQLGLPRDHRYVKFLRFHLDCFDLLDEDFHSGEPTADR